MPILSSPHRTEQTPFPQPLLTHPVLQAPAQPAGLCWTTLSVGISALIREPRTGHSIQMCYSRCQTEGKEPFPGTAHSTLLMQNMVGHFWCRGSLMIMLSLLNTRITRPFSSEPLFCQSAPSLFWCMGIFFLFLPLCRTWHLPMLIFMKFLSAHLSELAGSLRMATWYSTTSTTPQGCLLKICFEMPENNLQKKSSTKESEAQHFERHTSSSCTELQLPLKWMSRLTCKTPIRAYELHTCPRRLWLDVQGMFCCNNSDR